MPKEVAVRPLARRYAAISMVEECAECAKFNADWRDALLEYSRRSAVYAASAITKDGEAREEEAARIEGARLRAENAFAALRSHRELHRSGETARLGHSP